MFPVLTNNWKNWMNSNDGNRKNEIEKQKEKMNGINPAYQAQYENLDIP